MIVPADELVVRFSRSSGPGGQNVNKRETRVEVVWDVASSPSLSDTQRARLLEKLSVDSKGRLRVVASEERTQARNREIAIERLQELVTHALKRRTQRTPTRPSRASDERRLESKRARSRVKRDREKPAPD